MFFFTRRIIESIIITLISSVPIYLIYKLGFIPNTKLAYLISFSIGTIVFLGLNYFVLPAHLMAVRGSNIRYILVNGTICALLAGASLLMRHFNVSGDMYTALFGFTKVFAAFDIPATISAILFCGIYLGEIMLILAVDGKGIRHLYQSMN